MELKISEIFLWASVNIQWIFSGIGVFIMEIFKKKDKKIKNSGNREKELIQDVNQSTNNYTQTINNYASNQGNQGQGTFNINNQK